MKGRYARAIQAREELLWDRSGEGQPTLSILAVSLRCAV
jgi:hypothetical protein